MGIQVSMCVHILEYVLSTIYTHARMHAHSPQAGLAVSKLEGCLFFFTMLL